MRSLPNNNSNKGHYSKHIRWRSIIKSKVNGSRPYFKVQTEWRKVPSKDTTKTVSPGNKAIQFCDPSVSTEDKAIHERVKPKTKRKKRGRYLVGVSPIYDYFIQDSVVSTYQIERPKDGPPQVSRNINLKSGCARTGKSGIDSGTVSQIRQESDTKLKVC